ncbi:hypothetical protein [Actinomadura chokoriensis]|uniref:Uncharacterized protein n=1 Tax=Actinomadura chokoriensis TaxID=454156 RepID=A0ABV4R5M4_9ACTN
MADGEVLGGAEVHRPSLPRPPGAPKSIAMKKALFIAMEVASSLSCIHRDTFRILPRTVESNPNMKDQVRIAFKAEK